MTAIKRRAARVRFGWLLFGVLICLETPIEAKQPPRKALVIGNAAYRNEKPLVNTLNDAQDVAHKLEQLGFEVTRVENAGRRRLTRVVHDFVQRLRRSKNAVGLFYFSGHGMRVSGKNYLIPVDAEIQTEWDVPSEALPVDRVLEGMGGRGEGAVNLVVLDACRNNPYRGQGGKGIGDKGLARVSAPGGTLILYATQPGKVASDNPQGRNGLFTKYLLQALDRPGAQVEESFKQVALGVYRESRKAQLPWQEGVIFGRFYFRPPRATGDEPPPPPAGIGYLQVIVDVDEARVRVDGRSVGVAAKGRPLNLYTGVPAGEVEIEVEALGGIQRRREWVVDGQWSQARFLFTDAPPAPPQRYPLTVKPTPADARVRILNIGPKYRDGMLLRPGRYRVEVSRPGYRRSLSWFELGEGGQVHAVELEPLTSQYEPETVAIEAGCFMMGSPPDEPQRDADERSHGVCVEDFRIGKYEVTVGEFRHFVEATGYRTQAEAGDGCRVLAGRQWVKQPRRSWREPGFVQSEDHPVVCVSWNDALAYTEWLSRETGRRYRLPTEAEWEYAARAGTTGPFSFQGKIDARKVNYDARYTYARGAKDWFRNKTVRVGSLPANPWGLHEVHGNAWEWTCSGYSGDYIGGEQRCLSPFHAGNRANRGGSWGSGPWNVRSANRDGDGPDDRYNNCGFRIVEG